MLSTEETVELASALRLVVGRLARRLRQQSRGGLTPSQRSVLASLDRHGPLTMSALAQVEAIAAPSATGIVDRLVKRGLVGRTPHADDRRYSLVGLTQGGADELARARMERTAFLAERLHSLDESERLVLAQAVSILDRLAGAE